MSSSSRKRKQMEPPPPPTTVSTPTSQNGRVFTDQDEISLLKAFKKLAEQNKSSPSTPNTSVTVNYQLFNNINSSLTSKFTQTQITDKLRRLRMKYRKLARSKSRIKTPHDQALHMIARQIWGKKMNKEAQNDTSNDDEDEEEEEEEEEPPQEEKGQNENEEREEVDLAKYPVLVDEFSKHLPMKLMWMEALKSLGNEKLKEMNQKWKMIGIEEAMIVTNKADLLKEQTQLIMEALGDSTGKGNDHDRRL